jgi:hypothetical protein
MENSIENISDNVLIYCIFHKKYFLREDNCDFVFFGVNDAYVKEYNKKDNVIFEYELEKYNPFLQKRGYMETSVYLHVYWNKLYKNKELIGFSQYDMKHNQSYNNLDNNTIYLLNSGVPIVSNQEWNYLMCPNVRNLEFLIQSYNKFFNKNYTIKELESMPLSLWQTNIYPVKIYEKLCKWLEVLVDEIYPWSNQPPYETHFGSIGGYTERALAIFNAFEIYEGSKYYNLNIEHCNGDIEKEQYNKNSFLNNYSQDIHAKYIENVTGNYNNVDYCMFKSQCYLNQRRIKSAPADSHSSLSMTDKYFDSAPEERNEIFSGLNGITYSCERIFKNGKNGLYFKRSDTDNYRENAFDIEGEDPRILIINEKVYVVFICLSPYENQNRCIGITNFDVWEPIFLQIENMPRNIIEKNWAPFVKNDKLFFIYNYDPLIIIYYDFNSQGICNVVYRQENCDLPFNTSNTYLRGGSNLIHYKDGYYIGGCHSRIYKNCFEHYSHIVLLDTNKWELVYVSKPIMYLCDIKEELNCWSLSPGQKKKLDTFNNILIDKTPNIIQDPVSLYVKDEKFYMTINVRDCVSLLYEISFSNLFDFIKRDKPTGYYDNFIKESIIRIQ